MKGQIKFLVYIIILGIVIVGAAMYQKGYFSKEDTDTKATTPSPIHPNQNDKTIRIQSINKSMVEDTVSVTGVIINRKDNKDGHVFLTVKDNSGMILIPIFADKKINTDTFVIGGQFQFTGKVDQFNGEMEIIPSKEKDIVPSNPITKIGRNDKGQVKVIIGKVISKYTHPQGHIFLTVKVGATGQELDIPLFNSLHPDPDNYPINSEVSIKGKVTIYKKGLQIIPSTLGDLTILKKGDETSVQTVKLSSITKSDRGKMVITKGFVKNVIEKNGHLYFQLSADGKELKTILFKADSKEIEGRKTRTLNAEKTQFEISVLGMVDVYDGELELIIDKVLID